MQLSCTLQLIVPTVSGLCLVEIAFSIAAGLVLHLYSGMLNVILLFQKMLNTPKQHIVIIWRINLYMQCQHWLFAYLPQMCMMYVTYFW